MGCQREYVASSLERWWHAHIGSLQASYRWQAGCSALRSNESLVQKWIELARERDADRVDTDAWSRDALSFHRLPGTCRSNNLTRLEIPIEPLAGFLRHPYHICTKKNSKRVDKSYILLPTRAEIPDGARRALLFDAGASLWRSGLGGDSQSWFVDAYARRAGLQFARILAWEARPHTDLQIRNGLPSALSGHTSVYRAPPQVRCAFPPLRCMPTYRYAVQHARR